MRFGCMCGCGTTIDAAEKLGRDWTGIDVTQLAISLIKNRPQDTYVRRLKFVTGAPSHRQVGTGSTPSQTSSRKDGDAVERVPTESVVRIIGEPTTPNKAARDEAFKKAPRTRAKGRGQSLLEL